MMNEIKFKKIIYPLILLIVFSSTLLIFIFSTRFLLTVIKSIFEVDDKELQSHIVKLDVDNALLIAEKLGVEIAAPAETQKAVEEAVENAEIATTTVEIKLDKADLKIAVFNATKKSGLASDLKKELENNGFAVDKIGNFPSEEKNIFKIKESKKIFREEIEKIIENEYPETTTENLAEDEEYDIIILIGYKKL
ncbi:MAG: LytR C-terminal domain-containing protein [Patescibacteria group bacterium]